jgi:ketosteroid isomerase-like protein
MALGVVCPRSWPDTAAYGCGGFSGLHTKTEFLGNIPTLYANATGGLKMDFREITAEDGRVAVVPQGTLPMKDGRVSETNYNFLFHMRNGKIASGTELSTAAASGQRDESRLLIRRASVRSPQSAVGVSIPPRTQPESSSAST